MKVRMTASFFFFLLPALLLPHCSLAVAEDNDAITDKDKAALQAIEKAYAAEESGDDSQTVPSAAAVSDIKNPVCNMEATVTSVGINQENPAYYDLKVEIRNLTVSQATAATACGGIYKKQIENTGQLMRTSDYEKEPVNVGDDIKAQVQFNRDGSLQGYFLSNIAVTSPIASAAAVTKTDQPADSRGAEEGSTKNIIAAFSLLTLVILVGMIYASRDKSKKF